jgi:putative ABC transport system permease protein
MSHVSGFARGLLPESYAYLLFFFVVVMALKIVLDLFFITDMGLTMGAMGGNE